VHNEVNPKGAFFAPFFVRQIKRFLQADGRKSTAGPLCRVQPHSGEFNIDKQHPLTPSSDAGNLSGWRVSLSRFLFVEEQDKVWQRNNKDKQRRLR